ncbi:aldehyde dehydrogenase [Lentzea sp. JNUCC 0626]|uniref:aldehyde dehydrogenase n=1 Tax=Lentzea sp. JNUCC 0626 TaxID=3367513 RepID=UPI00374A2CB3
MKSIKHVIGGAETDSADGATFDDVDPYTQKPYATVALGGSAEADRAVLAARKAFDEGPWPRMSFDERGTLLHRLADLMDAHTDDLALADTQDMGKPISAAKSKDVPRSALNFRFFADHARLSESQHLPSATGHHTFVQHAPAGVVAAIAPWNFPLMLETWKIAPALAWGNTVVLKPAEDTPHSAYLLARLALEAGIPDGVFNVVHGYGPGSAGEALTTNPAVDRITFTGESGTGKAIARAAAAHLTPVSFELGGKGCNIVFDDADLDNAITWSLEAAFGNAGQVCLAGSRLYVHQNIFDEFAERFSTAAAALPLGDPKDPATRLGPLASEEHYRKVTGYLDPEAHGHAKVLGGGAAPGWFVRPTIVLDPPSSSPVLREEIFGPIVTLTPFTTEDEAVKLANDTPYGLSAMLFTENLHRAHRVASSLNSGNVWVNCFFVRDLRAPFGGFGDSGVGREGGAYSKEFFTEARTITMRISP